MNFDPSFLVAPKVTPPLDPHFRPAALATRAFLAEVRATKAGVPVTLALEQTDGSVSHFQTEILPAAHPKAASNLRHVERLIRFLLWSRGGYRVHFAGPADLGKQLQNYYLQTPTGKFDANMIGERMFERPFEVVITQKVPPAKFNAAPLGRHLDGCRIGFDLGASDRKAAAVVDGKVVFSEEVVWNPVPETDPQWHFNEIMDSLQRAAKHMPRVDAIGGSSAGVYVNNRVMVASLFRGVPRDLFNSRVKDLFLEIKKAWNDIPFEIVNDGEVTALAGSMALGDNAVVGAAMGSSLAGGYVNPEGNITSWINELAFVPVDYNPNAAVDEWSGDYGCGVQYFSQQGVGRLIPVAGIEVDPKMPLPEKLKEVQRLMNQDDPRARKIYETIGICFGYTAAHYADFYEYRNILVLGRVTTGPGGDIIVEKAKSTLKTEFPQLADKIRFHVPDEKEKRHGQAIAAASLPTIK